MFNRCGDKCLEETPGRSSSYQSTNITISPEREQWKENSTLGYLNVSLNAGGHLISQPILLFQRYFKNNTFTDNVAVRTKQGLAFAKRSERSKTLVESLKEQGVIDRAVFAFHISDKSNNNPLQSSLSFCSWDLNKYALNKDVTTLNLSDDSGYWNVNISGFTVNQTALDGFTRSKAEIDSSKSEIYLPEPAFEFYRSAVCRLVNCSRSQDEVQFNCSNGEEQQLPDLSFKLNEHEFPVSSKYYILKNRGNCRGMVGIFNENYYILGLPFMRAYYIQFDMDNRRIDIVQSINQSDSPINQSEFPLLEVILVSLMVVLVPAGCIGAYFLGRQSNPRTPECLPTDNKVDPLLSQEQEY